MPGTGPAAPPGAQGKHLPPPPHPNQIRRMEYVQPPPVGKGDVVGSTMPPSSQTYSGYPPPPQQQQPPAPPTQQRVPPYDGVPSGRPSYMYPPGGAAGPMGMSGRSPANLPPAIAAGSIVPPPPVSQAPSSAPPPSQQSQAPPPPSQAGSHGSLIAPPPPPPPTASQLHSSKQWIPPEGWPSNSSYQSQQQSQRPYPGPPPPGPPTGGPPSHGPPPSTTPTPPGPPGTPPHQAPSPQPWSHGGSPARQGPMPPGMGMSPGSQSAGGSWPPQSPQADHSRYGPGSQGPNPPSGANSGWNSQPPTQPGMSPRSRPPFPPPKTDYKGYPTPPVGMMPPAGAVAIPPPVKMPPMSQVPPVMPPHPSMSPQPPVQYQAGPPPPGSLPMPPPPNVQGVPMKKEIVFPPDSVEAVMPVLTKRKKLHKSDVAPVEAWRIMMCLKSGLLAEVTWSLDVLNVLLYDDHSVAYFSLSYLPGLMDMLLEHLRRALILIFGNGVGIDGPSGSGVDGKELEDSEASQNKDKRRKWYEVSTIVEVEQGVDADADLGVPAAQNAITGSRTVVLTGPNYTTVTRVGSRPVGFVQRDEEPFIFPGPRDWDADEKQRSGQDMGQSNGGDTMELTRHVVTSFTSDLNIVPIINVLKGGGGGSGCESSEVTNEDTNAEAISEVKIKVEPAETTEPEKVVEETTKDKINCQQNFVFSTPSAANGPRPQNNKKGKKRKLFEGLQEDDTMTGMPEKSSRISGEEENEMKKSNELLVNESDNAMTNGEDSNSSDICDSSNPSSDKDSTEGKGKEGTEVSSSNKKEIKIKDPGGTLKRTKMEEFEDECYTRDEPSLFLITDTQDALGRRCLSIFNILRNLTFVPGNDAELGKNASFLSLLGKLILLHHDHPLKGKACSKKINLIGDDHNLVRSSEDDEAGGDSAAAVEEDEFQAAAAAAAAVADIGAESCSSLNPDDEWWWDYLHHIREHVLVIIANISGQMDLSLFSEEISRPILDGLLHWAVCPSAYSQDPFPTVGLNSNLSPQRLAIEALCKLSVTQGNVDMLLATPPYSRIERLCALLTRFLCRPEDHVMREFAINLLSYLSGADSGVARTIALQNPCISLLISFIEQAEANAMNIANNHGFSVLRENPESMGTSLDMLRRAATTLLNLARHPDNRALFVQHEPRLLQLVMSQILEQKVAALVAQVLYQCSVPEGHSSNNPHYSSNIDNEIFYTPSLSRSRGPANLPPMPNLSHLEQHSRRPMVN